MKVFVTAHIVEEILTRVDNVKDLIRFKSVCKSWKSLILDARFVKAHLNHNIDKFGGKRIGKGILALPNVIDDDQRGIDRDYYVMGSSNGLVCIAKFDGELIVANPSTREMKTLPKPRQISKYPNCWGFGYDSATDDYKVVIGSIIKGTVDQTYFQVLSLKSNVWEVIRQVNYTCSCHHWRVGSVCNGALHWVMLRSKKEVILSFDLSTTEFKEIPGPDARLRYSSIRLGIMENCLCIYSHHGYLWIMKKYNEKRSWEIGEYHHNIQHERVECLKDPENDIPYESSIRKGVWLFGDRKFIDAPIVLQSLISPHLHACNK